MQLHKFSRNRRIQQDLINAGCQINAGSLINAGGSDLLYEQTLRGFTVALQLAVCPEGDQGKPEEMLWNRLSDLIS